MPRASSGGNHGLAGFQQRAFLFSLNATRPGSNGVVAGFLLRIDAVERTLGCSVKLLNMGRSLTRLE